jgi:hypothetical protein
MNGLNARLLTAHESGDTVALVGLYTEAADTAHNPDAAGFYLTHAYVFALELGHPSAPTLRQRLVADGRECDDTSLTAT